ncbi:hypothetical protein HDU87_000033 [Geranomyces variabilis]|uniref:Uncharacterized protein n=1 Tax=Geranomyces variabilis TaxID=109894 RepID=A0AAD5XW09_9FUNG|nr:hypothetical protein HDU87_000033 [Geranomyces variabilis]
MADWQNGSQLANADGESTPIPVPLPNGIATTHLQQGHPTPYPNSFINTVADEGQHAGAPQEPASGWSTGMASVQ